MNYKESISELSEVSFSKIRNLSVLYLRQYTKDFKDKLREELNRGTAVLETDNHLRQYLSSYGIMHREKINEALTNFPYKTLLDNDFEIIDWGCGQGLATVCFLDKLKENNINQLPQKVTLIEPSSLALERATIHSCAYINDDAKVNSINKYLDDVTKDDINSNSPITIHFFSNILDIVGIDLHKLAKLIRCNAKGVHYLFCISPLISGNNRLRTFCSYFGSPYTINDCRKYEHSYKGDKKCSLNIVVFKLENTKVDIKFIDYIPPKQSFAAYQLDGVKKAFKSLDINRVEQVSKLYDYLSTFEIAAPFDINASVFDDVHPILAVLNNIITRGLPTKASPMLERQFAKLGNKKISNDLGGVEFDIDNLDREELFLSLHNIDSRLSFNQDNYNIKLLESDFERNYLLNNSNHILEQILLPQRSLKSITGKNKHHSQRVDFAFQYPYSELGEAKGFVVEIDGDRYHGSYESERRDAERVTDLKREKWDCRRLSDKEIDSRLEIKSKYLSNIECAYKKEYNSSWIRSLQLTLSPIGVARIQKCIIDALLIDKLDINASKWNILVIEQDVPCSVIAIAELIEMFNRLVSITEDYSSLRFPDIYLKVISSKEFISSPLHDYKCDGLRIEVLPTATKVIKSTTFDIIIDISILRRAGLENISYSEFSCKNSAYFNIRSSHFAHDVRQIFTTDTIEYKTMVTKDNKGLYNNIDEHCSELKYFLQLLFRKCDFRQGQLPILSRALQNQCVIGLLPTGGGKSLTYQLAAMLQPGVTIVVDPLKSLMKDQYDGLINIGIDTCTYINSSDKKENRESREKMMENSQIQFVFLSPEKLGIDIFRKKLLNMYEVGVYFSYGVIDEVHCVSEWGHDFRFSYLHLGRNLYRYVRPKGTKDNKHITLFGLTATASFDVLADVERELSGDGKFNLDSETVIRFENTNRLELQYRIIRLEDCPIITHWDVYEKKNFDIPYVIRNVLSYSLNKLQENDNIINIKKEFISRESIKDKDVIDNINNTDLIVSVGDEWYKSGNNEHAAIVFCPHKKGSIGVNNSYNKSGITNSIVNTLQINRVSSFVGGDDLIVQDEFIGNKTNIMVATKAFGMGIDKSNVRFVLNVNYSSSLEAFVQEAGRAGRDKKMALATILYCDKIVNSPETGLPTPVDFTVHEFFFHGIFLGIKFEKRVLSYLLNSHKMTIELFNTDNENISGFIDRLLKQDPGKQIEANISYAYPSVDSMRLDELLEEDGLAHIGSKHNTIKEKGERYCDAIQKAIYRLCCIGVIDDFTQDYNSKRFKIIAIRRAIGGYYEILNNFLNKYYTKERAVVELQKAKEYKLKREVKEDYAEILKCLNYLTEFVYDKIAQKRYRAIKDIESFCSANVSTNYNWLEKNEKIKDDLYHYFNSKYARKGYKVNGEPFSLLDDTDEGKRSSFDIILKFMRVIDNDIAVDSSPTDNIKHLLGSVKLIRRSLTDSNPALDLLNVFCLLYLKNYDNKNLKEELKNSYIDGYVEFYRRANDKIQFYRNIENFMKALVENNRNVATAEEIETINQWSELCELNIQSKWLDEFKNNYRIRRIERTK